MKHEHRFAHRTLDIPRGRPGGLDLPVRLHAVDGPSPSGWSFFLYPPTWLPQTWAWENFVDVWTAAPLFKYITNSIIVAGGATVLNLALAVPAGYALARLRFPVPHSSPSCSW